MLQVTVEETGQMSSVTWTHWGGGSWATPGFTGEHADEFRRYTVCSDLVKQILFVTVDPYTNKCVIKRHYPPLTPVCL